MWDPHSDVGKGINTVLPGKELPKFIMMVMTSVRRYLPADRRNIPENSNLHKMTSFPLKSTNSKVGTYALGTCGN
jgi:hypothetical protein